MSGPSPSQAAAFFRVEGVMLHKPPVLAAAWLATNAQHLSERLPRLGAVALSAPFALGFGDAGLGHRLTWMGLRGLSRDRLEVLGEEYWSTYLEDTVRPVAHDLVGTAKRAGLKVVLVSDSIGPIVKPLADLLGASVLVSNQLEYRNERATGRLATPVVHRFGGRWLTEFAADHNIDLAQSKAYGARSEDQVLLSSVGFPCAVHPDRSLRRIATDLDWPVMERA